MGFLLILNIDIEIIVNRIDIKNYKIYKILLNAFINDFWCRHTFWLISKQPMNRFGQNLMDIE
mgnify:CR=1 FL=1